MLNKEQFVKAFASFCEGKLYYNGWNIANAIGNISRMNSIFEDWKNHFETYKEFNEFVESELPIWKQK